VRETETYVSANILYIESPSMEVKPNMKDSVANDPRDPHLSTLAESPLPSDDDDPSRAVARKRRREDDEYFKGLPPWYKFCCNDEDLVQYYLKPKVFNEPLPRNQIIDTNIYLHNPDFLAGSCSLRSL
jgi:hypothetical protein